MELPDPFSHNWNSEIPTIGIWITILMVREALAIVFNE